MTNADEVFAYFESRTNLERTPGNTRAYRLERMTALLGEIGYPLRDVPVIHVAGSKGKGSTAHLLTALWRSEQRRVGLYTSPHLLDYRERIRVYAGMNPTATDVDPEIVAAGRRLRSIVESRAASGVAEDQLPTTFELLTALAFLVFAATRCNVVVLETGLGGRLDATNVCSPVQTIITSIEREHTDYLGETLPEIAREKAGIAKPGVPLFLAPQRDEVTDAIEAVAGAKGAPVHRLDSLIEVTNNAPTPGTTAGTTVTIRERDGRGERATTTLPVVGRAQRTNFAVAVAAFRHPSAAPYRSSPERSLQVSADRAASIVTLTGRGDVRRYAGRSWILDGAHTPASVGQLVRSLQEGGVESADVLFGAVDGKDVSGMARELAPIAALVVVTRAGTFKPGDPAAVAETLRSAGIDATMVPDPAEALTRVGGNSRAGTFLPERKGLPERPVVVTGSFYLVAEVMALMVP